jgi:hypothetical protein
MERWCIRAVNFPSRNNTSGTGSPTEVVQAKTQRGLLQSLASYHVPIEGEGRNLVSVQGEGTQPVQWMSLMSIARHPHPLRQLWNNVQVSKVVNRLISRPCYLEVVVIHSSA